MFMNFDLKKPHKQKSARNRRNSAGRSNGHCQPKDAAGLKPVLVGDKNVTSSFTVPVAGSVGGRKPNLSIKTDQVDHSADSPARGPKGHSQHYAEKDIEHAETNADTAAVLRPVSQGRSTAKSKTGCLTCKYRKKKCDEVKPVCRDCRRFNKECVWVDYRTMNGEEIDRLKRQVREQESSRKIRKRMRLSRPPIPTEPSAEVLLSMSPEVQLEPVEWIPKHQPSGPLHPLYGLPLPRSSAISLSSFAPSHSETRRSVIPTDSGRPSDPVSIIELLEPVLSVLSVPQSFPYATSSVHAVNSNDLLLPFEHLPEPNSPGAIMSFIKEWSLFNSSLTPQTHAQIEDNGQETEVKEVSTPKLEFDNALNALSPSFSITNFLEQIQAVAQDSPPHLSHLASTFNATFSPSPQSCLSVLPELDQAGLHLYSYYLDVLSQKVSIAPNSQNDSNSYQRVFLPLAQKDKGVLYSILAWAGFHLGGQWLAEGNKYAEMALSHLCQGICFDQGSQKIDDRRAIINKLSTLLIMCGAEICRGDVKLWSVYLEWGWKLLKSNGGILNFNNNKEEHWLISNFAYHDLLASSTSDRGTYFPNQIYKMIFLDPDGISRGNLNPLLGVSKPLFKMIGDISSLFFESKQIMNEYYNRTPKKRIVPMDSLASPADSGSSPKSFSDTNTNMSDHTRVADMLNFISNKAHDLELALNKCTPDSRDVKTLSDSELELQLTTFEAFQLTCKLYLRQAILKINPSALECQILVNDLTKCLDILIDTPMQASLVFPVFIAGIFTVTEKGRAEMKLRFERLITAYGPWNVVRVKSLVEKIWTENPLGDRVIDWNAMLNDLNWDLNFA